VRNWVSLGGKNKRAWQLLAVFAALLLQFVLATAWADDDFDLGTVDPDLPAKIKTWNAAPRRHGSETALHSDH